MNEVIKRMRDDLVKAMPTISDDQYDRISFALNDSYIKGQIDGLNEAFEDTNKIRMDMLRENEL